MMLDDLGLELLARCFIIMSEARRIDIEHIERGRIGWIDDDDSVS